MRTRPADESSQNIWKGLADEGRPQIQRVGLTGTPTVTTSQATKFIKKNPDQKLHSKEEKLIREIDFSPAFFFEGRNFSFD